MPRRVVWIALHGGAADMGVRARALWVAIEAVIQARALIVNGGTLFPPCPHLFFRSGTRRPTAVRLQKWRSPTLPLLWLAAGGKFAKALSPCGFCREVRSDPLVDPLLHTTHF